MMLSIPFVSTILFVMRHAMKAAIKYFIIVVVVSGLAACNRQQPILTIEDVRIPRPAEALTLDQIKNNIVQAALDKGWLVDDAGPGELRATLKWKNHVAITVIRYSKSTYSIKLASSRNLKEENGMIHRKYNLEVQALEAEIDKRLYRPSR